tara:strand:- start:146 stop:640 length:495 start_codon:yes stop_codon:yes gene_type:complete
MRTPKELVHLCDLVGDFIRYWGFKKVDGTIWAHIYLSEQPLSAKDLMERMGISKAQVSLSIKTLMQYGVIEEAKKGDYGTTFYASKKDLGEVIKNVLQQREMQNLNHTYDASQALLATYSTFNMEKWASEDNVKKLQEMVQLARLFLASIVSSDSVLNEINEEA